MTVARGGRLPVAVDTAMERLNASVDVDSELWREDLQGSIAHARGLARAHVIDEDDAQQLVLGLERIGREIESGEFQCNFRGYRHASAAATGTCSILPRKKPSRPSGPGYFL